MNTGPGAAPGTALRVSHAERDRAVEMLQTAYAEGRIQHAELDRRIGTALAAKDRANLAEALRGIPLPQPPYDESTVLPSPQPAQQPTTMPSGDQRILSLIAHWSGLFTSFIGPVVIAYTAAKGSFVREQALEAANFQLTFIGASIALTIVAAVTFGAGGILFPFLLLAWFCLMGVGGLSAAAGNRWRYPKNLRLLS